MRNSLRQLYPDADIGVLQHVPGHVKVKIPCQGRDINMSTQPCFVLCGFEYSIGLLCGGRSED